MAGRAGTPMSQPSQRETTCCPFHLLQWASCALSPSNLVGGPASPPPPGPCSEAFGAPCRRKPAEPGVDRALAFGSRSGEPGNLGAGTGQL